jgi:vancomycin permeability regulator SanA
MRNYLLSKGVPSEDIFLDHAGFNTYDSLYRAKYIYQVDSIFISTQKFHMGRALYIGRKLGIDSYGYSSQDKAMYNMKYLYLREAFARIKAVFDTEIIKRESKFLGDPIPIQGNGEITKG